MDLNKCDIKIVKVDENNVEKRWVCYSKAGDEIIVSSESYGKDRVDELKTKYQEEKDEITAYDKVSKIAEVDDKLSELTTIENLLK